MEVTETSMSPSDQRVGLIFEAALELPPGRRAALLEQACAGDATLRRRVEALLRAHESAGGFMERPAVGRRPQAGHLVPQEQSGEWIGRYKLLQQIGEGGCGVVYMAEQQLPIRRRVALKIIKLGMDTKQVIARFEAERQALALMDHPNIAKVLDAGATDEGRPFFVMDLVAGEKLTDYCDTRNLSMSGRLELFVQVCRAVQHAHQKGVIHRDLKPSNVLVTEQDGRAIPKVIDFGIAKATGDQRLTDKTLFTAFDQFIGTPAYMSPEQAGLGPLDVDTRSDIYSLGVLLYELLTGQPPFDAAELRRAALDKLLETIREKQPPRPSTRLTSLAQQDLMAVAHCRQTEPLKLIHLIRGDLDWIAMKAMEKDRQRRYETANGLANDVERHLKNEPVLARPPSQLYEFQKTVRRHWLGLASAAAVLLVLSIGVIVSTVEAMRATRLTHQQTRLRVQAETARQQAEAAATLANRTLTASDFAQATRLIEADDGLEAVPYLIRILSANPDNGAALTRLATLLTYHSWMVPILTLRHEGWVTTAQFSPDARRIVTASVDSTARVWDAQTGLQLTGPLRHKLGVISAQFSPDGTRIATASWDHTARIWDASSGQPATDSLQHNDVVRSVQFSSDGNLVVTASDDGTAQVWDAHTGKLRSRPLVHKGPVRAASFSPDGMLVITATADGIAQMWDVESSRPVGAQMFHKDSVSSPQFSPDGRLVVTASADFTARIWDAQSGKPVTEPLQHDERVTVAQFSPDGQKLLTGSWDGTAHIWDTRTGRSLIKPLKHAGSVNFVQFSPDGRRVLTASSDDSARVWDAQTGQPLTELLRHSGAVVAAQFSPDGRRVLTASWDHTACVWDVALAPPPNEPLRHRDHVVYAQFSPDGQRVVTASTDSTAQLWDVRTGKPLTPPLKHNGVVRVARFSPDGRRVLTASNDKTARVWDSQTGQPLTEPLRHQDWVNCAQFSPDGQLAVTASNDETAKLWDAQSGRTLRELKHSKLVSWAEFSPDGKLVATASWDFTARVWDARTGKLLQTFQHDEAVNSARFSGDGRLLVTASGDDTARVWDLRTGKPVTEPLRHSDYVIYAEFSPDNQRVVTASRDSTARIWDAHTGKLLTEPLKHELPVNSAQFSPDGKWILTASANYAARVWDAQTGQPVSEGFRHRDQLVVAQFSPDGRRIVTASLDHTARIWDIGFAPSHCPPWLLQLAEALAGNRLDAQGLLEPTSLDRTQAISEIRQYLNHQPDKGDGVLWGRWLLADRSTRTLSPFSGITVPDYIQRRIDEGTPDSLEELQRLSADNADLALRFAQSKP